jgi:hypothetical protein
MYDAQRMHIEESPRYVSCYTKLDLCSQLDGFLQMQQVVQRARHVFKGNHDVRDLRHHTHEKGNVRVS